MNDVFKTILNEAAQGQVMDKLVQTLQKANQGQINQQGMLALGFNLASPTANNESVLCGSVATRLGLKFDENDFRAALAEIGLKSASDIVKNWLYKTKSHMYNKTQVVDQLDENTSKIFDKILKENSKQIKIL